MEPVYNFPASPGTPLFPVSPERANRQPLPQSPSLASDLHDPFKMAHLRENSDVQNKVAQFNSLSKEAAQRRKDNEAAMRRAVLGREEAESEARRLRDENRVMRKELEEGKSREKRVAQRIENVMVSHCIGFVMYKSLTKPRRSWGRPKRLKHVQKICMRRRSEERGKRHSSHRVHWLIPRRN